MASSPCLVPAASLGCRPGPVVPFLAAWPCRARGANHGGSRTAPYQQTSARAYRVRAASKKGKPGNALAGYYVPRPTTSCPGLRAVAVEPDACTAEPAVRMLRLSELL